MSSDRDAGGDSRKTASGAVNKHIQGIATESFSEETGLPVLPPPVSFANLGLAPPDAFANDNSTKEELKRNEKPPIPAKPAFAANRNMNNNTSMQSPMGTLNGTVKPKNLMLLREPVKKPSIRQVFSDDDSSDSLSDTTDDSMDDDDENEKTLKADDAASTSGTSTVSSVSSSSFDQITEENKDQFVLARISIPEQKLAKCMHLKITETVWSTKQRIIQSLAKKFDDPLNYGLYQDKTRLFLLDHKPISDYIEAGSVGSLQMRYKCRTTNQHLRNAKEVKHHTKMQSAAKRKDFLIHVQQYATDKIYGLMRRGIDSNFQCPNTGETPLTILSSGESRSECVSVFMALLGGGAHLDYRNRRGFTPMHVAARSGNIRMLKTLLEFKASPNVVDGRDLTPLYHCVLLGSDPEAARILLEHGAAVGCSDSQGWSEIHQACRYGRLQLLELLLNSDMVDPRGTDARNASGNTPLHVCSLYNQEACAVALMMHGADPKITNFSNQDAVQVAHVASNVSVAQLISEFPSRKDSAQDTLMKARAEKTSDEANINPPPSENAKGKSSKKQARSTWTAGSLMKHSKQYILQKQHSLSGTLGRSKDNFPASSSLENRFDSKLPPNAKMPDVKYPKSVGNGSVDENKIRIVVRNYDARTSDELPLRVGTRVIVLNARSAPPGYHDGMVDGQRGFFPKDCVEEVQLRRPLPDTGQRAASDTNEKQHSLEKVKNSVKMQHASADVALTQRNTMPDAISIVSFESNDDVRTGSTGRTSSVRSEDLAQFQATSTSGVYHNTRSVALWKGSDGYGFILRGAKSEGPVHEFVPSAKYPGLQYLESVEDGGNGHNAGLRSGDFIIRIGETDVRRYGHQQLVDRIRACGEPLHMQVTTVIIASSNGDATSLHSNQLDNVLAMEEAEHSELTASVRRIPGRKVGSEQLQNLFRENSSASAVTNLPQQSTFSSAKKPIRVLPPSLSSTNSFQYEHINSQLHNDDTRSLYSMPSSSPNSSTFPTWGRSQGPPVAPPGKDLRAHSVSGATGERLLMQSGARSKKVAPPPPKRISSRLSVSIPEEEQKMKSTPIFTSPVTTTKGTQHTTSTNAVEANTQSDMLAVIALAARNRAERMSQSEKQNQPKDRERPPTPPETEDPAIEKAPTKSVAEISSALSIALAAKQRSLEQQKTPTKSPQSQRPASFKLTPVKLSPMAQRANGEKEQQHVLPPPPSNLPPPPPMSGCDDVTGLALPPPPAFPAPGPHTQYGHVTFDELMLPPPPTELLPSPTQDSKNMKSDPKVKPAGLGFLPPPPIPPPADDDDGCTSPNGTDNLSNADSGVADVAGDGLNLSHGNKATPNDHVSADNHSTVSSLSTASTTSSSEDPGSDFSTATPSADRSWPLREVRNSSQQDDGAQRVATSNNPTGSMYLNVLKKAKNKPQQTAAQPDKKNPRPGVTVTKMTFAPISVLPPPAEESDRKPKTTAEFPPAPKEYSNSGPELLFSKAPVIQTQKMNSPKAPPAPVNKTPPKTTPAVVKEPAGSDRPPSGDGNGSSAKKPLTQWSVTEVCDWLKELGLQMYVSSFEENQIAGEHLPDLGKDELIELGVKPFGHRLTIDRSIKKLVGD